MGGQGEGDGAVGEDEGAQVALGLGKESLVPGLIDEIGPGDSLRQLVDLTIGESQEQRAGGECIRLRLSELMFVEVVRRHLAALSGAQSGWLAGLRDDIVGGALALLHERPAHPWTLHGLAGEVGRSRSALADRLVHFVAILRCST